MALDATEQNAMQLAQVQEKALTGKEAAELLGICLSHLYNLLRKDSTFPQGARLGRSRRWMVSDLLGWMERRALQANKRKRKGD